MDGPTMIKCGTNGNLSSSATKCKSTQIFNIGVEGARVYLDILYLGGGGGGGVGIIGRVVKVGAVWGGGTIVGAVLGRVGLCL